MRCAAEVAVCLPPPFLLPPPVCDFFGYQAEGCLTGDGVCWAEVLGDGILRVYPWATDFEL